MIRGIALLIPVATCLATNAPADTLTGDSYVTGRLCIGSGCVPSEGFGQATAKLKSNDNRLTFEDISTAEGFPANNWQIWVNDDFFNGLDRFTIRDRTGDTMPFTIEAGAPDNSMWIDGSLGNVGLGTSLPQRNLHIYETFQPTIRFEQPAGTGIVDQSWDALVFASGAFAIVDSDVSTWPIHIARHQPSYQLSMAFDGVAIGTPLPQAKFHVLSHSGDPYYPAAFFVSDDSSFTPTAMAHVKSYFGNAQLMVENIGLDIGPKTMLHLKNPGRPEIVMSNTKTGGEWSFGAGSNFILKQGAVGTDSSVKTKLFEIDPAGNATLTGSLTTGGTTCGGGCDRVFTEQAIIPASDYAARMWKQGYLPHVGPTPEGAPINVSEKLGGMLNALEHAHVFIDRQARQIEAQNARLANQDERIAELETLVSRLLEQN